MTGKVFLVLGGAPGRRVRSADHLPAQANLLGDLSSTPTRALTITPTSARAVRRADPTELWRSGGERATDTLQVVPCSEPSPDGRYRVEFFSHGIRHLPRQVRERMPQLEPGERLYLMRDLQNPWGDMALMLVGSGSGRIEDLLDAVRGQDAHEPDIELLRRCRSHPCRQLRRWRAELRLQESK
jgi:hypothetical protein